MSRADWIRGMSNEELALFIRSYTAYYEVPCDYIDKSGKSRYGRREYCLSMSRQKCTLGWLAEEATESEVAELKEAVDDEANFV